MKNLRGTFVILRAILLGVLFIVASCSDDDVNKINLKIDAYVLDNELVPIEGVTLERTVVYGVETKQGDFYEDEKGLYFRGIGQISNAINLGTTDANGKISVTDLLKDKKIDYLGDKQSGLFTKQGGIWSTLALIKVIGNLESNGNIEYTSHEMKTNAFKVAEAIGDDAIIYEGFLAEIEVESSVEKLASEKESTSSGVQDVCERPEYADSEVCKSREDNSDQDVESNTDSIQVSEVYQEHLAYTKVGLVKVVFRPKGEKKLNFLETANIGAQGEIIGRNNSDRSTREESYGDEVVLRASYNTGASQQ